MNCFPQALTQSVAPCGCPTGCTAKISYKAHPKRIARSDVDSLKKAIDKTKIMAPPASCIAPIGEAEIIKGLKKEVEADFYTSHTRSPVVYRGHPIGSAQFRMEKSSISIRILAIGT